MHVFDRYKDLTDLSALKETSARPLRKSKRVNTLKIPIKKFEQYAQKMHWKIEPVPWCPEGFFIDREDRETALGKDLLHMMGGTYMQEAASMLPVALLDPQPGETILDMSAAPGSKTTQIAARMQRRGVLIANDMQEKRLWTLNTNLQRCGVMNAIIIKKVGQWYSRHMTGRFDRVLCDAPCTAQGTLRKDPTALDYSSHDNIQKMVRLQCDLLEAAIHTCKVGGRIVYSTCTLTPEENEGVVSVILNKFSEQVSALGYERLAISDLRIVSAFSDSNRVQDWLQKNNPTRYSLSATRFPSLRLWPQTFDTEGFFCAVLEKHAPTRSADRMDLVHRFEKPLLRNEIKAMTNRLADWYGVPFLRDDETLMASPKQVFITTKEVADTPLPTSDFAMGLPFGKATDHGLLRLSHDMATLRGLEATQQIIDLSDDQFQNLIHGHNVQDMTSDFDDGDVLLRLHALPDLPLCIGRGLLKNAQLLNRLPREIVQMHS